MRKTTVVLAGALSACALVPTAHAAGAPKDHQTPRQAQIVILSAPRRLARIAAQLVDPRTRLVRSNTQAVCRGVGRPVRGTFHILRCTIRHGRTRVVVRYTAVGRYGAVFARLPR
jgi:hypothetical protein